MTFELGFRPSAVLVCGHVQVSTSSIDELAKTFAFSAGNVLTKFHFAFFDTGFTVLHTTGNPMLTISNRQYDFIAFR